MQVSRQHFFVDSERCIWAVRSTASSLGWVNLAMVKILEITLGVDKRTAILIVIGLLLFTAFYTTISGLWGVLVTDLFQFVLKMGMVVLLAVLAVNAVGGIDALKTKIVELDAMRRALRIETLLFPRCRFRMDCP